jgi:hypothetical protein
MTVEHEAAWLKPWTGGEVVLSLNNDRTKLSLIMTGPNVPGPNVPGPNVPGPNVPRLYVPGLNVPKLNVPRTKCSH